MTVVGTRPEIIRLSQVIKSLDRHVDHILVHTGQNYDYELSQIFFDELNLRKPDYFLDAVGQTTAETIGNIITKIDCLLDEHRPDAFLVLGDTNSCLSVISAKRRHIPIFHMEAGNRCFDARVPEETNRRIVDHTADINLPYSDIAREYLLREGFPPDRIIKTGSPMYEVISAYKDHIMSSKVLTNLDLNTNDYFVVSCHREENIDSPKNFLDFTNMLNQLAQNYSKTVIVSTHPRTRKKLADQFIQLHKKIVLLKPLGLFDYLCLQLNSKAVLSDSGTITEESSILNFPALNIRDSHERPEGMEEGAVIMTGMNWHMIRQALALLDLQIRVDKRTFRMVADYDVPNVSDKIVRIILSYTDYVNKTVWKTDVQ